MCYISCEILSSGLLVNENGVILPMKLFCLARERPGNTFLTFTKMSPSSLENYCFRREKKNIISEPEVDDSADCINGNRERKKWLLHPREVKTCWLFSERTGEIFYLAFEKIYLRLSVCRKLAPLYVLIYFRITSRPKLAIADLRDHVLR